MSEERADYRVEGAELAEAIAQCVNLQTLDMYRRYHDTGGLELSEVDQEMKKLGERLLDDLGLNPTESVAPRDTPATELPPQREPGEQEAQPADGGAGEGNNPEPYMLNDDQAEDLREKIWAFMDEHVLRVAAAAAHFRVGKFQLDTFLNGESALTSVTALKIINQLEVVPEKPEPAPKKAQPASIAGTDPRIVRLRERLDEAQKAGCTTHRVAEEAGFTEQTVRNILAGGGCRTATYEALDAALTEFGFA